MHVGRAHEQRAERPLDPRPRFSGNGLQRHEDWQRPDLAHEARQEALVRLLRDPGPEEQPHDEEHVGGDGEEIRLKGAEAGGFELQGEVLRHGVVWDEPGEAEEVDGPHVVVGEAVPEGARRERLPVVHVPLAGIVAQDAVHHDALLALVEPAVAAAEPAPRLRRRGGQVQEGDESDAARQEALEGEEPAPPREAVVPAQVQDAEGEEGGDYAGGLVGDPEEAEADGQFDARVEIAEVEDVVRDEAAFQHAE